MTESIFVPFVLTTKQAAEKAAKVLLGKNSPRIKRTNPVHFMTKDEAISWLEERKLNESFKTE